MHLNRLCSVRSASAQAGTYLACALELWFALCSLESGEGGARCILLGYHSEAERTGPKRKAVPLCQEVLSLPGYPVTIAEEGKKQSVEATRAENTCIHYFMHGVLPAQCSHKDRKKPQVTS